MHDEENIKELNIRSEGVQEILGIIPSWIVRRGMTLFLFVFFLLLAGSYLFQYPHIVRSDVVITTENPPSEIVARADGRIMNMMVKDNAEVREGQILAVLENTSDFSDVLAIQELIGMILPAVYSKPQMYLDVLPSDPNLGSIQPTYMGFRKGLEDLNNFLNLDYHNRKINSLESETNDYKAYIKGLERQSALIRSEAQLSGRQYGRDSLLYIRGVIPESEYEASRSLFLSKTREYEQSRANVLETEIKVSRLEQEILDLQLQRSEQYDMLKLALDEALKKLSSEIKSWEQSFLLKTTVAGIVSLTRIRSEDQYVSDGDLVMTVIPRDPGEMIARLELQPRGAGRVKPGMPVRIRLDNYPYMEYGMLSGRVKSVSLAAVENAYTVIIELPEGLKTMYNKEIGFSHDMRGIAEIIANRESLLARIINPIKSLFLKQKSLRDKQVPEA